MFVCQVYLTAASLANSVKPDIYISDYFVNAHNVRLFWAVLAMVSLAIHYLLHGVMRSHYRQSVGLAIQRSRVRLPLGQCWLNNLRQVVHTLVPLTPSNISWYRCKNREGNDMLWNRCGLPYLSTLEMIIIITTTTTTTFIQMRFFK